MEADHEGSSVEAIRQLRARYFRALDSKDWPLFAEVFTADATADGREGFAARSRETDAWTVNGPTDLVSMHLAHLDVDSMVVRGGYEIAEKAKELFPPSIVTVHHGHTGEIRFESATIAHGVWAMEDRILYPEGFPIKELHGFGHYHDDYRREAGTWRISAFRLTRLRVDIR